MTKAYKKRYRSI